MARLWILVGSGTAATLALMLFLKWRKNAAIKRAAPAKLNGKLALVTGATGGIGLGLAKQLALAGCSVVLAGRNKAGLEAAVAQIKATLAAANVGSYSLSQAVFDLRSLRSVAEFGRQFRERYEKLDILVCNAGIMNAPYQLTDDAIESHFQINHLSHFLLLKELREPLVKSGQGRVVLVGSGLYKHIKVADWSYLDSKPKDYRQLRPYSRSKLANCLHCLELAKREPDLTVAVCCPGFVRGTDLGRHHSAFLRLLAWPLIWFFSRSLEQGVQTPFHCATAPDIRSGRLYVNCELSDYTEAVTAEAAEQLWQLSEALVSDALAGRRLRTVDGNIVLKRD